MARDVDIPSVLFTTWVAHPCNYNTCYQISFKDHGSGLLVLGYGQSIYAMVKHRFEVQLPNLIRLTYVGFFIPDGYPHPERLLKHPFARVFEAEFHKWSEIRFELFECDFRCNEPPDHIRWLVAFDRPPYPKGVDTPHGPLREFYGPFNRH